MHDKALAAEEQGRARGVIKWRDIARKDSVDLRWNKIRRRITREVDVQIADWREEKLNELLGAAWEQYKAALATGGVLELEARYDQFVGDVIGDVVDVEVEGPTSEAA